MLHSGDLLEQLVLLGIGFELLLDPRLELGDIGVGMFESPKLQTQNEAVVFLDATLQRRGEQLIFLRSLPRASSAICSGVGAPSTIARNMSMPDTPNTLLTTLASLTPAA